MIGMACLYGCFLGFGSAMETQANLTALAARRVRGTGTPPENGLFRDHCLLRTAFCQYTDTPGIHEIHIAHLEFAGPYAEMVPVLLVGSMIGVTMGIFITSNRQD